MDKRELEVWVKLDRPELFVLFLPGYRNLFDSKGKRRLDSVRKFESDSSDTGKNRKNLKK